VSRSAGARLGFCVLTLGLLAAFPFVPVVIQARQVTVRTTQVTVPTGRGQATPQRDPTQPPERRVPVGTSTIAGTVTAVDTGRPIPGARVTVNGTITMPEGRSGRSSAANVASPMVTAGLSIGAGGQSGSRGMSATRSTMTDAQGRFEVGRLPAGRFTVTVTRTAYLNAGYGQKRPGGPAGSVSLEDGQKATIAIPMVRGGVISGMVFGENGEPQANTRVQAWRSVISNGLRRWQPTGGASTDDRGMYRLHSLQPGDYLVSSTPNSGEMQALDRLMAETALIEQAIASGRVQPPAAPGLPATVAVPMPPRQGPQDQPPGYLPVYYPSAPEPAAASRVHVDGGDEHPNVDIQLRLVQAANVQGTVTNIPGEGLTVQVWLLNEDPLVDSMMSARLDQNGFFVLRTVPPGRYTLAAEVVRGPMVTNVDGVQMQRVGPPPPIQNDQRWWGRTPVLVGYDSPIVTSVTLQPGKTIAGEVVFEGTRPSLPPGGKLSVFLTPAPGVRQPSVGGQPRVDVEPDGRFAIHGVVPGRYILRASGGGYLKSVMIHGEDTLDFPLDFTGERDVTDAVLTITDALTEISGTLSDGTGDPGPDHTIVIAASEERFWTPGSRRIATARTNGDGRYTFRNMPAGDYLIAVVTDFENGSQYDPEFLRTLVPASVRIRVTEGATISQDLRIQR